MYTGELGYDRLNGTRKIGPSYAKSVVYIWRILDMHRTGTEHIVRHMQKSVVQWSVISKFTCNILPKQITVCDLALFLMSTIIILTGISQYNARPHNSEISDVFRRLVISWSISWSADPPTDTISRRLSPKEHKGRRHLNCLCDLTLMLVVANFANSKWYKNLKYDPNHGKWVLIWEYSARAFQWVPTWQDLDDFHVFLHSCVLNKNNLSIRRVKYTFCRRYSPIEQEGRKTLQSSWRSLWVNPYAGGG